MLRHSSGWPVARDKTTRIEIPPNSGARGGVAWCDTRRDTASPPRAPEFGEISILFFLSLAMGHPGRVPGEQNNEKTGSGAAGKQRLGVPSSTSGQSISAT